MLWLKTSGRAAEHRSQRLLLDAEEVRRQHLDRRLRHLRLERADRGRVVAGAAVGDVVAVDRGHDDVLQLHLRGGLRRRGAARAGRAATPACRSGRSSSGTPACRCRRGSGTSPSHGPSTRRCSGSGPPRRSCADPRRGSACGRRSSASPSAARAPSSTRAGAAARRPGGTAPWPESSLRPFADRRSRSFRPPRARRSPDRQALAALYETY